MIYTISTPKRNNNPLLFLLSLRESKRNTNASLYNDDDQYNWQTPHDRKEFIPTGNRHERRTQIALNRKNKGNI